LHRWGYRKYTDLFNARQLLGLELSCRAIMAVKNIRIRRALATNLSDLLRYQNMLCRYDTMALKSLDIFSVHGFPVGLVQCESNLIGTTNESGANVGSGGWTNIIDKYAKAKRYCDTPFEIQYQRGRKVQVPVASEWIGENRKGARPRKVRLRCASSTTVELAAASLDAVFTDPPYFGNVQYAMVESAIEDVLSKAGVSYRKTKRAERVAGFDQAPDFIVPDEFSPSVVIEAKLTEDDGTARDKVTRVQRLRTLRDEGKHSYQVVACIAGRGFKVRRNDMRRLLQATCGKVFTLATIEHLTQHTRIKDFVTR
jgi:hypothetical protein